MKKKLYISAIALVTALIVGALALNDRLAVPKNVDADTRPIARVHAWFAYDVSDARKNIGFKDYVFVGRVVSNDGTHYEHIVYMEDALGLKTKKVGSPYTDYTLEVLYNIKGELKTDTPITIMKEGGVMIDGSAVELFEGDELPLEGKLYIFLAAAREDGTLTLSGPNSNVALSEEEAKNIPASGKYQEYVTAYEEEIIPVERERFSSVYEKEAG
jgi:hypothetical protein